MENNKVIFFLATMKFSAGLKSDDIITVLYSPKISVSIHLVSK